jgi:hypothetical protein
VFNCCFPQLNVGPLRAPQSEPARLAGTAAAQLYHEKLAVLQAGCEVGTRGFDLLESERAASA